MVTLWPKKDAKSEHLARPVFLLDMIGNEAESCSSWDIWTAGIDIERLCIARGKNGHADGLGKSLHRRFPRVGFFPLISVLLGLHQKLRLRVGSVLD